MLGVLCFLLCAGWHWQLRHLCSFLALHRSPGLLQSPAGAGRRTVQGLHCCVETRPQSLPFLTGVDPVSRFWLLFSWFYGEAFLQLVGCLIWKGKNTFRAFRTQWRKCEEKYALLGKGRGCLKWVIKPRGAQEGVHRSKKLEANGKKRERGVHAETWWNTVSRERTKRCLNILHRMDWWSVL